MMLHFMFRYADLHVLLPQLFAYKAYRIYARSTPLPFST